MNGLLANLDDSSKMAISAGASPALRPRVLLVPDATYWILGTIAKGIASANPWMDATIISGAVLEDVARNDPAILDRFDLVHFICPYASNRWLKHLRTRLPVVTSHHHVTEWSAVSHNLEGDAIVTGSAEWSDDIVARGADAARVICVPYGVDSELFVPGSPGEKLAIRRRLALPGDGPVVGFFAKRMSNDDDRKGIDVFHKAVLALHSRLDNAAILIVGPGWQSLVSEFQSVGIRCVWLPFLEKLEDVAPLYRALDFYWVTARVEGGPVPLLEAMSSEICCLTTPVGLARDIVEDGINGVVLPMNDPSAFVEETVRLWNEPGTRLAMAAEARKTIQSKMDMGNTLQGVREVYALACENFDARTGAARSLNFDRNLGSGRTVENGSKPRSPALDARERAHVEMLEALAWTEHLLLVKGQKKVALRLLAKAWKAEPTSLAPLRVFFRRYLPVTVVRRIVSAKHALTNQFRKPASVG